MTCYDRIEKQLKEHDAIYPNPKAIDAEYKARIEKYVGTKAQIAEYEEMLNREKTKLIKELLASWNEKRNQIVGAWIEDLYVEYFEGYPRELFDICYALAYDEGHSCGYSEVENYLTDLEGKFKKAFNLGRSSK